MKSTRMIELRTTMPAPAMKPIIEVAVKNAPISRVRRQDADERERDRGHDESAASTNDWNQPTTST